MASGRELVGKKEPGHEDDPFDDIVLAEERFTAEGYAEGLEKGRMVGYDEGFHLGKTHGASVGSELGFYFGFVDAYTKLIEKDEQLKERKEKAVHTLLKMIRDFPFDDPENLHLQEKMQDIRAKFKQVCSLLSITPDYKSSQAEKGISF